jgi:hypothetical protein
MERVVVMVFRLIIGMPNQLQNQSIDELADEVQWLITR